MEKPNFDCDLHCHTNRSDGLDSPKELIDLASENKMKVVAISDHDILPVDFIEIDNEKIDVLDYAAALGIKLLKAVEFSCDTFVDDVHLVAYGCNWENEKIKRIMEEISVSKVDSYKALVNKLNEKGYELSWEEILNYDNIKRSEKEVQKKLIFNLMADKKYVPSWKDAKLLVKKDKELSIKREKPLPKDVIEATHEAGGIIVLAHPYLIEEEVEYNNEKISRQEYINKLISFGLDGIEGCYTYDKTSYSGKLTKDEANKEVTNKYKDKLAIISGGSDYHGEWRKGLKNSRYIGECGITYEYFLNNKLLKRIWMEE